MKEKAIEKLQKEIDSNKKNQYIGIIGKFLIGHINEKESFAEHVLKDGKTINGSIEAMKSEAKKKAKNGMAMLSDEEGFAIVVKYFEKAEAKKVAKPKESKPQPKAEEQAVEETAEDDSNIDDLL